MKLEYLDDITEGGRHPDADPDKTILLYSFDHEEVEKLINTIQFQLVSKGEYIDVSALPFVQPINCSLFFEISNTDEGIDPSSENKFVCRLSIEGYKRMISYMSIFSNQETEMNGFNWLYDPPMGKIDLLFSPGGTW